MGFALRWIGPRQSQGGFLGGLGGWTLECCLGLGFCLYCFKTYFCCLGSMFFCFGRRSSIGPGFCWPKLCKFILFDCLGFLFFCAQGNASDASWPALHY